MDSGGRQASHRVLQPRHQIYGPSKLPASQGQPETLFLLLQAVMALTDLLDCLILFTSSSEPDMKVGSLHA